MKKILIYPEPKLSDGNFYLVHVAKVLENRFIVLNSIKGYLINLVICHFILLNWFESIGNNPILLLKRLLFLLIAVVLRKRIIWTIHNKIPHDGYSLFSKLIVFLLLRCSYKIHILCNETRSISYLRAFEKKCYLVPHGDYFGDFPFKNVNIYGKYNIELNSKIILFSGAVRPYKNIELLISAFSDSQICKKGFSLLIRGTCNDKKFLQKIECQINGKENIFFDPTFIPIDEMNAYLHQSVCLVAPYRTESALNSGTLWMALSYKKTMIIPKIGSVLDIKSAEKFLYSYSYVSDAEHRLQLRNTFCRLANDACYTNGILQKKGELGYEYMQQNSWMKQKNKWYDLFS